MFEVGWTEMLVIAIVLIVVVGPKDLPRMLRTFGRMTTKMRGMAGDFQKQFNEALKEAELDDVKKSVDAIKGLNPTNEIRKHVNPFQKAADDIRAGVDAAMKPKPAEVKPAATVHPAEPLKNGATAMPGVEAPKAMPEPPLFPADEAAPAPQATPAPTATAAMPAAPVAAAAAPIVAPIASEPAAAKKRATKPKPASTDAGGGITEKVNGAKPKPRAKAAKAPTEDVGEPATKKPAGA